LISTCNSDSDTDIDTRTDAGHEYSEVLRDCFFVDVGTGAGAGTGISRRQLPERLETFSKIAECWLSGERISSSFLWLQVKIEEREGAARGNEQQQQIS